jgi:hypothetical protein
VNNSAFSRLRRKADARCEPAPVGSLQAWWSPGGSSRLSKVIPCCDELILCSGEIKSVFREINSVFGSDREFACIALELRHELASRPADMTGNPQNCLLFSLLLEFQDQRRSSHADRLMDSNLGIAIRRGRGQRERSCWRSLGAFAIISPYQ